MANVIEFTIKTTDKFTGTMKKVGKSISSTAKTVESFSKKSAIAATAVVAFTTAVANGVDQTAKFSSRIGVAVEELSKMQFVAGQAGISADQFNMATQRMTRRVAEAAEGMGEAKGALAELGIDAERFKGLGLEDQMATLATSMEGVEAPADRLRLAFKLFDSEGTAMIQMLQNGSGAMREAARDAEFLGLAISQQAAANAEAFMDSMGRATGSIKGTSRAIADELMPLLTGLANRFADSLAESRDSIVSFVKRGIEMFFTFGAVLGQVWDGITEAFTSVEGFSAFLDNLGAFIVSASKSFLSFAKMIPVVIWEGIKAAMKIIGDFASWVGGALIDIATGKDVKDFSDTMSQSIGSAFKTAGKNIKEGLSDPLEEFKKDAAETSKSAAKVFGINMEEAEKQAKTTMASISQFGKVVEKNLGQNTETAKTFMEELNEVSANWLSQQKNTTRQYAEEFFNVMQNATSAVADGIAESIVEGKNAAEVFSNIGKQIAKELISMWIKVAAQRVIAGETSIATTLKEGAVSLAMGLKEVAVNTFKSIAAIPIIGPILAVAATAAAVSAVTKAINAAGSQGAGLAGARADGGPVTFGKTYLVGERGPEFFTPNVSGNITSNETLNGMGGGRTVMVDNFNMNVHVDAAGDLSGMDSNDIREKFAVPLIEAFDELANQGVTFEFARRKV